jgi:hypothetical protein
MLSQLANGQLNLLQFDSDINDGANEGALYSSNLFTTPLPGFHVVDGGHLAVDLFPNT